MARFFCIYSGKEHEDADRSDEHIVPYAIGGSDHLVTRDVSRRANSTMGATADAGLVNSFPMRVARWRRGLASEDGHVPDLELLGRTEVAGAARRARFVVRPDLTTDLWMQPSVKSDWSKLAFEIACDARDLGRIIGDIEKRSAKQGRPIKIDANSGVKTSVATPTLDVEMKFDVKAMRAGYVKMGLAMGHRVLGYEWSASVHADVLRGALSDETKLAELHGWAWPDDQDQRMRDLFSAGPDRHVLMVTNTRPLAAYVLLFGEFAGGVRLAAPGYSPRSLGRELGRVTVVDTRTRKVFDFDREEYISRKHAHALPFVP